MATRVSRSWRNAIVNPACCFNEMRANAGGAEQLVAIPYEFRYTIVIGDQESTVC